MHPIVWLAIAGALLAGCGTSGPRILVTIDGELPPQVSAFRVTGQAGEAMAITPATLNSPIERRFTSFLVQIPPDRQGLLRLKVDGLRLGDCALVSNTVETPLTEAVQQGVHLVLKPLAVPECQLQRTVIGAGAVRCTALDASATAASSDSCDALFALGAKVRMHPEPAAGSTFLGWTGDCQGRDDCDLEIRAQPRVFTAHFHISRLCTSDHICWESPLPTGAWFRGLWSSPEGELWVVGQGGVILRRQSGTFYPVGSDTFESLSAVWGSSKDDVWIVGGSGLVLHWDGRSLAKRPEPQECGKQTWTAVWGRNASDIWMVGRNGAVQRWDGSRFRCMTVPTAADLYGIGGLPDNRVAVVGAHSTLLLGNADGFSALPVPAADLTLRAVHAQDQTIWAVGAQGTIVRADVSGGSAAVEASGVTLELNALYVADQAVWAFGAGGTALRRTKAGWDLVATNVQPLSALTAAAGSSADDFWVVGTSGSRVHWNGAYFVSEQGSAPPNFTHIRGPDAEHLWLGDQTSLYQHRGGSIYRTNFSSPGNEGLYGILPLANGEALLGRPGGLVRYQEHNASQAYLCPDQGLGTITAMDSSDPSYAYAVTANGQFVECIDRGQSGVTWEHLRYQDSMGRIPPLSGVWAAGLRNTFAIGKSKYVYWLRTRYGVTDVVPDFLDIRALPLGVNEFLSIHGSSLQNLWVGGPEGVLILSVYDGATWSRSLVTTRDLAMNPEDDPQLPLRILGVWARHEEDGQGKITLREVWAVGDQGLLLRVRLTAGQPAEVKRFATGTSSPLHAVWGFGRDDVWAVGELGAVLHYDPRALDK